MVGCSGAPDGGDSSGTVTLEFAQWWEPELPADALRGLMDEFEADNPGIKVELLSGPYASTKEQLFAGAAAGTMSDVVGLDGAWISDFAKQGALADLSTPMDDAGYDDSQLAAQIELDGSTYMIPVINFVYPMFTNDALLAEAGIDSPPSTRSEFEAAANALNDLDSTTSGWVLPSPLKPPTASRTTSCRGCGHPAEACSKMASPTSPTMM